MVNPVNPAKGIVSKTDMGWEGEGPWTYRLLQEPHLSNEFNRQSSPREHALGSTKAYSVTIQPCPDPEQRSQDRHVVEGWEMPGGIWSFLGVFDGHGGHDTADYTLEKLPSLIRKAVAAVVTATPSPSADVISSTLSNCITSFDQSITDNLLSIFPGGEESIKNMSDAEIKSIINDQANGGNNASIVARCMRGTTALVALVDPLRENLWVASLGDCVAILGATDTSQTSAHGRIVSSTHNGQIPSEAERVRREHPDENEAILRHRVLGSIAVTRALGDHLFKLPLIYTERIFLNAAAGFKVSTPLREVLPRIKTPPYVGATPDVNHVLLKEAFPTLRENSSRGDQRCFLIMCSDGLVDLSDHTAESERWARVVGGALSSNSSNAASALLRYAFGGDDAVSVSRLLTVEMCDRWIDDTTIIVLPL